jgi:hypothetical protein
MPFWPPFSDELYDILTSRKSSIKLDNMILDLTLVYSHHTLGRLPQLPGLLLRAESPPLAQLQSPPRPPLSVQAEERELPQQHALDDEEVAGGDMVADSSTSDDERMTT